MRFVAAKVWTNAPEADKRVYDKLLRFVMNLLTQCQCAFVCLSSNLRKSYVRVCTRCGAVTQCRCCAAGICRRCSAGCSKVAGPAMSRCISFGARQPRCVLLCVSFSCGCLKAFALFLYGAGRTKKRGLLCLPSCFRPSHCLSRGRTTRETHACIVQSD